METQRRGVETAGAVAFVTDGSEWLQKFVDHHRADAVRMLDFPHAAEYLAAIGQAGLGAGSERRSELAAAAVARTQTPGPDAVLAEVQRLVATLPAESPRP